eukprot:CAMPEP_0195140968 /NCGR_PEP_ID=MMETSP0448-20130528/162110_1 /TAXON_ID=66468 /ORGANISM="Heterocapsa triquestra, Strain CCMP 448" /LENGTH=149 /DNA_ID=CAMNT_0040179339 /DNA_START=1 /DNA_END=447 /DNA_ORIENTATION=+
MSRAAEFLFLCVTLWCRGRADCPESDRVKRLPLFGGHIPFKLHSGMLEVPGPINGYDSLRIHYYLESSQGDADKDPLVVWQQGGPGGSSISTGAFQELGYFLLGTTPDLLGVPIRNPWSWNRLANMLYLDHPAGVGASTCIRRGEAVPC